MKSKKIPGSFIALGIILFVFIIFLFVVFMPLIQKYPTYEAKHTEAVAQIAEYENVLANQKTVEEKVAELQEQYDTKQKDLFVDADTSVEELQRIFQKLGISMTNLTRSESKQDSLGRVSSIGVPLYSVVLTFSYDNDMATTQNLLHYLEQDAKGCYYINTINMAPKEGVSGYSTSLNVTLYYFDTTAPAPTQASTQAATTKK